MQTQRQLLEKAEAHYNKVNARLKELSANYQEGSATKLMESLSEDVNSLRFQVWVWMRMCVCSMRNALHFCWRELACILGTLSHTQICALVLLSANTSKHFQTSILAAA
eukprot:42695-Pelagomonas_calceolata.AAC.6